jgi:lipid-A-disaccharide synthase-like uncharacterized protein
MKKHYCRENWREVMPVNFDKRSTDFGSFLLLSYLITTVSTITI